MVNPFERKNFLPLLGFLPSEIRFQNNNGNGDMDLAGGFGAQAGGAQAGIGTGPDVPGADIPGGYGEAPSPAPEMTLERAMEQLQGAYPSTPSPSLAITSEPSTMDDVSRAFSPPSSEPALTEGRPTSQAVFEFEEGKAEPSRGLTIGQMADKAAELGIRASGLGPYGLIGAIFGLFGQACITLTGHKPGELIDMGLTALGLTQAPAPSAKTETAPAPAPSVRGTPISVIEYSGMKSEGNLESVLSLSPAQKAPSSYPSRYYAKTPPQSLSTSLFGVTEKVTAKEGGGLMIFPSSASGIEKEGSSLLKKREPVIDSTSMLFLLGMGVVGMVLRKGGRA
jgi:hypothetical protein